MKMPTQTDIQHIFDDADDDNDNAILMDFDDDNSNITERDIAELDNWEHEFLWDV